VKTFYSAQDIENLAAQGIRELVVDDNTVLTDIASDVASQLGIKLVRGGAARSPEMAPRTAAAPAPAAVSSGSKPKGCQHGPLSGSAAGPAVHSAPRSSGGPIVDELVGAVKQLAGKQGRG
jgi:hypothetical protein